MILVNDHGEIYREELKLRTTHLTPEDFTCRRAEGCCRAEVRKNCVRFNACQEPSRS